MRLPRGANQSWAPLKAWSDSEVVESRTLLAPEKKLKVTGRLLLRSANDSKVRAAAVGRHTDTGFDGQLNPALAESLGATAEGARCDIDYRPLRSIDLVRYGRGGIPATVAALLGCLFALGGAAAGLATTKLPVGIAIALLVAGVLAAGAKLVVDLRALKT